MKPLPLLLAGMMMVAVANAAETKSESTSKEQKPPVVLPAPPPPPPMPAPVPAPPASRSFRGRISVPSIPSLTSGDYTYLTNANGEATVVSFNKNYSGELVITNSLGGCPVTRINSTVFIGCTGITSVIIPASVTNTMVAPSRSGEPLPYEANIFGLGAAPFTQCRSLTNIIVEASNPVYRSTDGVLFSKDQTMLIEHPCGKGGSYRIPEKVTGISGSAFYSCTNLTSVTIPNSVTRIGNAAFYRCTGLTNVTMPATLTNIASSAFLRCDGLTNAFFDAYKKSFAMVSPRSRRPTFTSGNYTYFTNSTGRATITSFNKEYAGALAITNNLDGHPVTEILPVAFFNIGGLTSVSIPASITNLVMFTRSSSAVPGVNTPRPINLLGIPPFVQCKELTAVNVDNANPGYSSVDGVLFNKDQSVLLHFPAGRTGSYRIPDTVTAILGSAFCDSSLTNVTIPKSVNSIGRSAFLNAKLTDVTINNGVTTIGDSMFSGCAKLTSVSIPPSVSQIGYSAFSGCSNLTAVSIPTDLTNISSSAFYGCPSLPDTFLKKYGNAPPSRRIRSASSATTRATKQQTVERLNEMLKNISDPAAKERLKRMISTLEKANEQDPQHVAISRWVNREETLVRLRQMLQSTTDPAAKQRLTSFIQMLEKSNKEDPMTSSNTNVTTGAISIPTRTTTNVNVQTTTAVRNQDGKWVIQFPNGNSMDMESYVARRGGMKSAIDHVRELMDKETDPTRLAYRKEQWKALKAMQAAGMK